MPPQMAGVPTHPMTWIPVGMCLIVGLVMLVWRGPRNRWIGVRWRWTEADRDIWDRSWRVAAWGLLVWAPTFVISYYAATGAFVLFTVAVVWYPMRLYYEKYGTLRVGGRDADGWRRPMARCRSCEQLTELDSAEALPQTDCPGCGKPLCRRPTS